ncbi:MAG: hypothetical protein OEZ06_27400 [Myxococcales bacterium]|nr:hypothetical protein [Myxococcales bacterium]
MILPLGVAGSGNFMREQQDGDRLVETGEFDAAGQPIAVVETERKVKTAVRARETITSPFGA